MINFNGNLVSKEQALFSIENRAFKYGDGVFETLKMHNSKIIFFEDHYFRLMASMRMLRMEIPSFFTLEYLQSEILKTVKSVGLESNARVRISVCRKEGGFYSPKNNEIDFTVSVDKITVKEIENYSVDLFKDYYVQADFLSTIKTINRILNVVASIYTEENDLDSCLLMNDHKNIVESIQGNVFLVFGDTLVTPPISEGCVKGIVRKKIIEIVKNSTKFSIEERPISPFEIKKADELFITNSIIDIQSVIKYRKKNFATTVAATLDSLLKAEYS